MTGRDEYYNRAKQEGYRARSAYKLQQLDETAGLLGEGRTVVDLGAAPGGWMQVASERVGPRGTVVGVDRQRIDPLEEPGPTVQYVRGDVTGSETKDAIREAVSGTTGEGENRDGDGHGDGDRDGDGDGDGGRPVDLVLSDMAPEMSGEYDLDHARSVHLARQALGVATALVTAGGDLAVKIFDGRDLADLEREIEEEFEYVRQVRPEASRDASSELYLVAKGRLTAPVRPGDEREVEIVDVGSEGDGVAKVGGFTLFVDGVDQGETVTVEITDVKPRFGFARPV
jgi:23S rRNA (uridine2552-2'-O)-methyltransferase